MQWRGRDLAVDPGKVSTTNLAFSCQFRIQIKRKRRTRQANIYSIFTLVRPGATLTKHLKLQRKKAVNVL